MRGSHGLQPGPPPRPCEGFTPQAADHEAISPRAGAISRDGKWLALVPRGNIQGEAVVVFLRDLPVPTDGLLPWGFVDNRPFLRCLHGFGLCCWRLGRFDEAERVFRRMLWLNPSDNQGARFMVDATGARRPWEDRQEEL